MPVRRRKNRPTTNEPLADSPTRFLPAYRKFMALIEWPPRNIECRGDTKSDFGKGRIDRFNFPNHELTILKNEE